MRFNIFSVVALHVAVLPLVASTASHPPWALENVVKRGTAGYNFDLFQGENTQEATSKETNPLEYTTGEGVPYANPYQVQRVGQNGPLLLQDAHFIENMAHFNRERIPERVVHAKGSGAHGYFQTTTDVAKKYSMADIFQRVGEMTPLTMRFSTVSGETGSPDVIRDPRGIGIKFRTKKGILDWVFNNTPVFFIRDPLKFPTMSHVQKRNPQTNLKDATSLWDFFSNNPETLYQVMRTFSDLGTPASWRHMNIWSSHTYRLIQTDNIWVYVKVIIKTDQGIMNNTNAMATQLAGTNPDALTQDLFSSIESGNYPSWTVYFQTMTPAQAETFRYNVLDLTKEWDELEVPPQEVGRIYLTQNPQNHFAEIEQAAFSPSNMVQGWLPSADPMLQARLFAYPDTQRYRLGANFQQIPVNCPFNPVANFQRDGYMAVEGNQGNRPEYDSTIYPLSYSPLPYQDNHTIWTGGAVRYLSEVAPIDFELPRFFWGNMSTTDQDHLVSNVVQALLTVPSKVIRLRQAKLFALANSTLGARVAQGINVTLS